MELVTITQRVIRLEAGTYTEEQLKEGLKMLKGANQPKVAMGQTWRTRDGDIVTVDEYTLRGTIDPFPFKCSNGEWVTEEGRTYADDVDHGKDLVECLS